MLSHYSPKVRLPRCSALAGAIACLALASVASAQTPAPQTTLPTSVRLKVRVKPGDAWEEKASDHAYVDLNLSALNRNDESKYFEENTQTGVLQHRIRTVGADGVFEVESTMLNGKETGDDNGTKHTETVNERNTTTVGPDNVIKKTVVQKLAVSAGNKAAAPRPVGQPKVVTEHALEINIAFPDKAVSVGDTWEGTIPFLPRSISEEPNVSYQAKLTKIEIHNGVPCACVEYTFDKQKITPPKALAKALPDGTNVEGSMKVDGRVRHYYSLDRGIRIEALGSLIISIQFHLTRPASQGFKELDTTMDGSIQIDMDHTARKLPAYDPSLVTPDSKA